MALNNPLDSTQIIAASSVELVETAHHPAAILSKAVAGPGRAGSLPTSCILAACGSTEIATTVNVSGKYAGDVMYQVREFAKIVILWLTCTQCRVCQVIWRPVQPRNVIHQRWFDIVDACFSPPPTANYTRLPRPNSKPNVGK